MKPGTLVRNFVHIGSEESYREKGKTGLVLSSRNSILHLSHGDVARILLTVLLEDGYIGEYDSVSFESLKNENF